MMDVKQKEPSSSRPGSFQGDAISQGHQHGDQGESNKNFYIKHVSVCHCNRK